MVFNSAADFGVATLARDGKIIGGARRGFSGIIQRQAPQRQTPGPRLAEVAGSTSSSGDFRTRDFSFRSLGGNASWQPDGAADRSRIGGTTLSRAVTPALEDSSAGRSRALPTSPNYCTPGSFCSAYSSTFTTALALASSTMGARCRGARTSAASSSCSRAREQVSTMELEREIRILKQVAGQDQHHGFVLLHESLSDQLLQPGERDCRCRLAADAVRSNFRLRQRHFDLAHLLDRAAGRLEHAHRFFPRRRTSNPDGSRHSFSMHRNELLSRRSRAWFAPARWRLRPGSRKASAAWR